MSYYLILVANTECRWFFFSLKCASLLVGSNSVDYLSSKLKLQWLYDVTSKVSNDSRFLTNNLKWILNTVLAVAETSHFLLFLRVMATVTGFLQPVFLVGINILEGLEIPVQDAYRVRRLEEIQVRWVDLPSHRERKIGICATKCRWGRFKRCRARRPAAAAHDLPTQLTESPLAGRRISSIRNCHRNFLLKSPRAISVSVTMIINAT